LGFLLGGKLRPLLYQAQILQVEIWYGKTEEVRVGLLKYLDSVFKFLHVDRIVIPDYGLKLSELTGFEEFDRKSFLLMRK
jgi:hypothetical protein